MDQQIFGLRIAIMAVFGEALMWTGDFAGRRKIRCAKIITAAHNT